MKLTSDRTSIVYNEFLTLGGVPNEAFEYRIGARSALEWVIDQIKVTENVRSDITSDPNRPDDEEAIVRLIGQVVQVSVETTRIVRALPSFELSGAVKKAARRPRSRK
jgi:predicted helicase